MHKLFCSIKIALGKHCQQRLLHRGLIKSLKPTVNLMGVSSVLVTALSRECESACVYVCVCYMWMEVNVSRCVHSMEAHVQPSQVKNIPTSAVFSVTQEDMLFFNSNNPHHCKLNGEASFIWKVKQTKTLLWKILVWHRLRFKSVHLCAALIPSRLPVTALTTSTHCNSVDCCSCFLLHLVLWR